MSIKHIIDKLIKNTSGAKYKFLDNTTNKKKTIHNQHIEEDIVITLPDKSGVLVTSNTVNKLLEDEKTIEGVTVQYILKPDITENNGGIVNSVGHNRPLKAASYRTSDAFTGPHELTEWQLSLTPNFNVIVDSSKHKDNLLSWDPNISNLNQKVYVRYRFYSGVIMSPWSNNLVFTTPDSRIEPFVVTATDAFDTYITSGPFKPNITGVVVNHKSTTFTIYDKDDNIVFRRRDENEKYKLKIHKGVITERGIYKVGVRYHTDYAGLPESKEYFATFKTPPLYITTPSLTYKKEYGQHILYPSPYSIFNGTDKHVATDWEFYRKINGGYVSVLNKTVPVVSDNEVVRALRLIITGYLSNETEYYKARVRYKSTYFTSDWREYEFKVPIQPLKVLQVKGHLDKDTLLPILNYNGLIKDNTIQKVDNAVLKVEDPATGEERYINLAFKDYNLSPSEEFSKHDFDLKIKAQDFVDNNDAISWNKRTDRFTSSSSPAYRRRMYNINTYLVGATDITNIAKLDYIYPVHFESEITTTSDTTNINVKHNKYLYHTGDKSVFRDMSVMSWLKVYQVIYTLYKKDSTLVKRQTLNTNQWFPTLPVYNFNRTGIPKGEYILEVYLNSNIGSIYVANKTITIV